MLLVYMPAVIPPIWKEWSQATEDEYTQAHALWEKRRVKATKANKSLPKEPQRRMYSKDTDNFLALAAAMKILLAHSLNVEGIPLAKELLSEYLSRFREVDNAVSAQAVRSAYRGVMCWLAKGIGDGLPEVTGRVVRRDIPVRLWEIVDEIYVLRVASS